MPFTKKYKRSFTGKLVAKKSKNITDSYKEFFDWKKSTGIKMITENTLLAYFTILSNKLEPNSLLKAYLTIKSMLWKKENINIRHYNELNLFLKKNYSKEQDTTKCGVQNFSDGTLDKNLATPNKAMNNFLTMNIDSDNEKFATENSVEITDPLHLPVVEDSVLDPELCAMKHQSNLLDNQCKGV